MMLKKYPSFALLWFSQSISQLGSRIYQIALVWYLLNLPGQQSSSEMQMSLFLIVSVLPGILFVKKIGKWVDQFPSKKILALFDSLGLLLSAVLLLLYTLGTLNLFWFLLSGFVFSTCFAFIDPSLNRMISYVVKKEDIGRAMGFVSSTQPLSNLLGAVLGALLIDSVGLFGVIIINGITYLLSILCDLNLKTLREQKSSKSSENSQSSQSTLSWLKKQKDIYHALLAFSAVNFFGTPLLLIMPLYVKNIFKGDASMLGWMEAAISGGLVLGAFSSSSVRVVKNPYLFCALCLSVFGFCLTLPIITKNPYAYGIILFTAGLSLGLLNAKILAHFQNSLEDSIRGSFFALLQALVSMAIPLGYFAFALLVLKIPLQKLSLLQGLGVLSLSSLFYYIAVRSNSHQKELVTHEV